MTRYISPLPATSQAFQNPRRLVLLGSTGSIGQSAIRVIEKYPDDFQILGLAGATNVKLLASQANRWRPPVLGVLTDDHALRLSSLLRPDYHPEILVGVSGYKLMASWPEADMILCAQVGAAGLLPALAAVESGKWIALANKETLVLAGNLIQSLCAQHQAVILPVDSEHSALFQCLMGHRLADVERLHLTASGGPFRGKDQTFLNQVTPAMALAHPNWSMGPKVTIDSATLMNKGLEFIEAYHLFGMEPDKISVVIHPESIVHSLVEYRDGSFMAHIGLPDMQIPIALSLFFPELRPLSLPTLNLSALGSLQFQEPDVDAFPCLTLAKSALTAGPSHPVVLNAANEVAVELFLKGRLPFIRIPWLVASCLEAHPGEPLHCAEDILDLDRRTRENAQALAR